jgi:hypothetical protein
MMHFDTILMQFDVILREDKILGIAGAIEYEKEYN